MINNNRTLFLQCAEEAGIKLEDSITHVDDYPQAERFINALSKKKVCFEVDLSPGNYSGKAKIGIISKGHICIEQKDFKISSYDVFKYKDMLIISSELSDQSSPKIFIEADTDINWLNSEFEFYEEASQTQRYIILYDLENKKYIYKKENVSKYLNSGKVPFQLLTIHTRHEMLVFAQLQGFKPNKGNLIIHKAKHLTCRDIISGFSSRYKEI